MSERIQKIEKEKNPIDDIVYVLRHGGEREKIQKAIEKARESGIGDEEIKNTYSNFLIKNLEEGLEEGIEYFILKIKNLFGITNEDLASPEIKKAYLTLFLNFLSRGRTTTIQPEIFGITNEEIRENEEIQKARLEGIFHSLEKGNSYLSSLSDERIFKIKREELAKDPRIKQSFLKGLVKNLKSEYKNVQSLNEFLELQEEFGIANNEIEESKEIREAYLQGLATRLLIIGIEKKEVEKYLKIKNLFGVTEEQIKERKDVQDSFVQKIIQILQKHEAITPLGDYFLDNRESFGIEDKDLRENTEIRRIYLENLTQNFKKRMEVEEIKNIFNNERVKLFGITPEELRICFFNSIVSCVEDGFFERAKELMEIQRYFNFEGEDIKNKMIEENKKELPSYVDLINETNNKNLSLEKAELEDIFLLVYIKEYFSVEELKQKDFLIKALEENKRFAYKIIKPYKTFGETQPKVDFLFRNKEKINEEGVELRKEMQERLKGFMNNNQILEALNREGINTKVWLNYNEEKIFILKDEKAEKRKSIQMEAPLKRTLKETINSYLKRLEKIKKTFGEREIVNPKAIAIIRSLEGASDKARPHIEKQLKKVPEKIKINHFIEEVTKDIVKIKERIEKLNQKLIELETSNQPLKEIKKVVSKIEGLLNSLDKKISSLNEEIENIGKEIPEINQVYTEEREIIDSHLKNDIKSLKKVFKEKESRYHNREIKIKVWDRNPHIESYLGNYTGCCIPAEEHHGTIFSYLTDLGYQIVEMIDQEKKDPIAAAWCWLGKEEEGKTYLVIDNIEANTDYSGRFGKYMWEQIISYIKNYMQEINVDEIRMGKAYNDLQPEEGSKEYKTLIEEHLFSIKKIGGYNGERYYKDYV